VTDEESEENWRERRKKTLLQLFEQRTKSERSNQQHRTVQRKGDEGTSLRVGGEMIATRCAQ